MSGCNRSRSGDKLVNSGSVLYISINVQDLEMAWFMNRMMDLIADLMGQSPHRIATIEFHILTYLYVRGACVHLTFDKENIKK